MILKIECRGNLKSEIGQISFGFLAGSETRHIYIDNIEEIIELQFIDTKLFHKGTKLAPSLFSRTITTNIQTDIIINIRSQEVKVLSNPAEVGPIKYIPKE